MTVHRFASTQTAVVQLHNNDFELYVEARKISDEAKILAGWQIKWGLVHYVPVPNVTVKPTEKWKPNPNAKPNTKKAPPGRGMKIE